MSLTEEQAGNLYDKIQTYTYSEFSSDELDLLQQMLRSEILLKALGRTFYYVELCKNETLNIEMDEPGSSAKIAKIQGRAFGVMEVIQGLIRLVTEQDSADDKDEENVSTQPSLN